MGMVVNGIGEGGETFHAGNAFEATGRLLGSVPRGRAPGEGWIMTGGNTAAAAVPLADAQTDQSGYGNDDADHIKTVKYASHAELPWVEKSSDSKYIQQYVCLKKGDVFDPLPILY